MCDVAVENCLLAVTTRPTGKMYRVAQKPVDTIGNVLNTECEVTFTPLCRSVCHPVANLCPVVYRNYFNKSYITFEGPVLRISSLPQKPVAVKFLHIKSFESNVI